MNLYYEKIFSSGDEESGRLSLPDGIIVHSINGPFKEESFVIKNGFYKTIVSIYFNVVYSYKEAQETSLRLVG